MSRAAEPPEIIVAAAADLSAIEQQMKDLTPELKVKFVFGSSGQLTTQIRSGAPFDVFLSASMDYVRDLDTEGRLVVGTAKPFARGRLAIYSKKLGAELTRIEQLTGRETVAIANPLHAPYGQAAQQALRGLPNWAAIKPKLVIAGNVRQALQFAETGNTDVAIIAWPLVKGREGAYLVPMALHAPIIQGLGVVRSRDAERSARRCGSPKPCSANPGWRCWSRPVLSPRFRPPLRRPLPCHANGVSGIVIRSRKSYAAF